jgi:exodeoxyribonuclease-3
MQSIISWNVNGINSVINKKAIKDLCEKYNPSILCLSETKLTDIKTAKVKEYFIDTFPYIYISNSQARQGYAGTAILSKIKPLSVEYYTNGASDANSLNNEGRLISLEFSKYTIIVVYTPNSGEKLKRLDWRVNEWDVYFRKIIKEINKPVIIVGDLNVAHKEIDIKNPSKNQKSAGFTIEERNSFTKTLDECKLIDVFRHYHPDIIEYTYWSYRFKAREKNIGWRIDYVLVSEKFITKINKIMNIYDVLGSDHSPIYIEVK